ncbi:radical SAM-associated putative lipoprotein [Parabacteroides sp.]
MSNLYHSILKGSNWILAGLLSGLGFGLAACDEPVDEYGAPYAEYKMKGKVTDMDGKAIQGISITIKNSNNDYLYLPSPLQTREDGNYDTTFESFPEHALRIIAEDIDGEKNGSYEADSVDIEVGKFEGGKSWYVGKAEVNVPDIKLKKKETEK